MASRRESSHLYATLSYWGEIAQNGQTNIFTNGIPEADSLTEDARDAYRSLALLDGASKEALPSVDNLSSMLLNVDAFQALTQAAEDALRSRLESLRGTERMQVNSWAVGLGVVREDLGNLQRKIKTQLKL